MKEKRGEPSVNDEIKKEMYDKMMEKKQEGKTVRKIVSIIAGVFLFILIVGGVSAYAYINSALKPVDENATTKVEVEIPMGSGISVISKKLEEAGIIKSATVFKYYAKFNNQSNFQAGSYTMTPAMTLDEILESLKTGKIYREPVFTITVPEGLSLEQIAAVVAEKTKYTAEQFMERVTEKEFVQMMIADYPNLITDEVFNQNIRYALEGYLYPATYPFYEENPSLDEIIGEMVGAMDSVVLELSDAIAQKDMTVHEFLTFASLLEEEATATTDRETIASVFYNRLETGMPLQTDPTVLYALGQHKDKVLFEDLKVQNAYNTYVNEGLPPGPIAGAGKTSLEATLNPSDTEYLYFLADEKGVNHFAKTFEEHKVNRAKYID